MAKRDNPNDYYAWYNDDDRLAIVEKKTTTTDAKGIVAGDYDTFIGNGSVSGTITNMITDGSTVTVTCSEAHDLDTGNTVTISGTALYDEDYSITVTSTTEFTFASAAVGATADTVSNLVVSSGTATATTSAAHGYSVGDVVYIDASNNTYDEKVTIVTVADTTTFTYTTSNDDVGSGVSGTVGDTGTFSGTRAYVKDGIKMTIHSKYETASNLSDDLYTTCGLNDTLHTAVLDYVKSRVLEDMGDIQKSTFFSSKYIEGVHKKSTRKSGVRILLVPEL